MAFLAFQESIQLIPDGTLLIHIAMILAMIWILNRTFFRPINRIIESREKSKGGHASEAEGLLKDAGEKKDEYTKALRESRAEGYELIEKERAEALTQKLSKVEVAKQEVSEMLDKGNSELEKQTTDAAKIIAQDAEKMAEKISSNILNTA